MIGNCDACGGQNVPVSNCNSSSGETTQCFLCQGGTDPDPYCELEPTSLGAAKKLLVSAAVGSCTCNTKSPELLWHAPNCRYVLIMTALENVEIAADRPSIIFNNRGPEVE